MHELSIANSLVEIATGHAAAADAKEVTSITLRIGALSCVHENSLEFCFEVLTKDTPLAGAKLVVIKVPVTVYCAECDREVELPGIQQFRCPICKTPTADVRSGKELDLESIEIVENNSLTA